MKSSSTKDTRSTITKANPHRKEVLSLKESEVKIMDGENKTTKKIANEILIMLADTNCTYGECLDILAEVDIQIRSKIMSAVLRNTCPKD